MRLIGVAALVMAPLSLPATAAEPLPDMKGAETQQPVASAVLNPYWRSINQNFALSDFSNVGGGPLTNGQVLIGSTGNNPSAATLTAGAGIQITNGAGSITVATTGIGTLSGDNNWSGTNTFASVVGAVVTESTTSRTLSSSDCGKLVRYTNGSSVTVTVPNSLPAGCNVAGIQIGAGQVTVAAGSGANFLPNPHTFTRSFGVNAVFGITVDSNGTGTSATFTFVGDGA